MRSGTLDIPAIAGLATAAELAVKRRRSSTPTPSRRLRDDLVRRVPPVVPDAVLGGDPDLSTGTGCPATRTSPSPAARATRCCCCSTPAASSAPPARPARPASPQPSHVLLAMGVRRGPGPRLAAVLPRPHLHRGRRRRPRRGLGAGRRAGPRAAGRAGGRRRQASRGSRPGCMRVLAAMCGGVDSAVAAARAVDAGHDVTGVHLALSAQPAVVPHRRARLLHPRGRPRRAPGRRRARHPVLRLGPGRAVPRGRGRRLRGRVRRRSHAEPVPALQREDQVRGVLDKARALGFDAVVHRPLRPRGRRPAAAPGGRPGKDQSYVLAVLTADQLAGAMFPLGDTRKSDVRAEADRRGLAVADKPDSHDICFIADGDTAGFLADRLGPQPGPFVDTRRRACRRARRRLRVHGRAAPRAAARHPGRRRQAALRPRHRAGHRHGHGRPGRGRSTSGAADRGPAGVDVVPTPVVPTWPAWPRSARTASRSRRPRRRRRALDGRADRAGARRGARSGPRALRRRAVLGSATIARTVRGSRRYLDRPPGPRAAGRTRRAPSVGDVRTRWLERRLVVATAGRRRRRSAPVCSAPTGPPVPPRRLPLVGPSGIRRHAG